MQEPPGASGIDLANWYWKAVRQFAGDWFGIKLSRTSCLNWMHRLGFAFKRPKERLSKADEAKREAFMGDFAALKEGAQQTRARIFFADEAHFRADAELRGKWVLKGQPALVDSNQPAVRREGQLLCGGVPGDGRGGMDGTGGQQQQRDLGSLLDATEGKTFRAAASHLGQRAGPSWRGGAGILRTRRLELRSVNLPGYTRTSMPMRPTGAGPERRRRRISAWAAGLRFRKGSVSSWPGCPAGETRWGAAAALSCNQRPKHTCETPLPIPSTRQMHIQPWLWFRCVNKRNPTTKL